MSSTSVNVSVYTTAHTITHVTTNILSQLKDIIRQIGLDPSQFINEWSENEKAVSTWLNSRHLSCITLEVFNPSSGAFVTRWDIDVNYSHAGDGSLWVDKDAIRYHIQKAGLSPNGAHYRLLCTVKPGAPVLPGWNDTQFRDTSGFSGWVLGPPLVEQELLVKPHTG
ncbi:MAG: HORMA domain containing protein [Flavobacteriales bacterium]|nr:HORMA domain containing protein [Flavobacteriales bacterium]